ncbi:MAG: hypothetical protein HKN04_11810 [Rhodothermaceae bacterium]|nr:hypothetical protein [Rhodothermaceae bacterium]
MSGDSPYRPARAAQRAVLARLRRWLDIELLSGGGFVLVGFLVPTGLLMLVVSAAALIFAPILVHALWALGRRGWLLAFGLGAALPALVGLVSGDWFVRFVGVAFALVAFYALCAILRAAVRQWQEDADWQRAFEAGLTVPSA